MPPTDIGSESEIRGDLLWVLCAEGGRRQAAGGVGVKEMAHLPNVSVRQFSKNDTVV